MKPFRLPTILFLLLGWCLAADTRSAPAVTNEYHGVKVSDPFQWLENASDQAVQEWTRSQNGRARSLLDKSPIRAYVEDSLVRLMTQPSTNYYHFMSRGGTRFFLKFQPPAQQPVLITLGSLTNLDSETVILDPNKLSDKGAVSIDWYVPSLNGKLVAVCLSEQGSERGALHFFDVASGQKLPDIIPGVNGPTAGGSASWNGDGSAIFYTRYPRAGERPEADLDFYQQVYLHKLGTQVERDTYEVGKDFPRIAETHLETRLDGRYVLATVANGDGGQYAHYLRDPSGAWKQVTRFEDEAKLAQFGRDPLYIEWGN